MTLTLEKTDVRFTEGRFNFAPGAKVVPTRFLTHGLVSYRDQPGGKVEMLKKETIDAALASLEGCPVTIGHVEIDQAGDVEVVNGKCTNPRFNAADGWFWCDCVVETDKARQLIEDGQYPSCGYEVTGYGPGNIEQNIRYDREITGIRFNHMAIVERPRYTDSIFRLNSIPATATSMNVFTLLKKVVTGDKTTTVEHKLDGTSEINIGTVEAPQMVRLNDLGKAWMEATKGAVTAGASDCFMIEGCDAPVNLNELKECYKNSMQARKNETEMAEKKKKDDEETAKKETERQNALTTEQRANELKLKTEADQKAKDEADALARKNALGQESFRTLQGAQFRTGPAAPYPTSSGSMAEKLALGAKRY